MFATRCWRPQQPSWLRDSEKRNARSEEKTVAPTEVDALPAAVRQDRSSRSDLTPRTLNSLREEFPMSYSLRDLPLPVKVVASVFLMAVGVGYTSAMVQLHMQDAKSGKPMPTMEDVILKYTGKKKFTNQSEMPRPAC